MKTVQLRVLTYNIHGGEGMDGKYDYERLSRVIRSVDPDLVALQEVDVKTTRASGVDQATELSRLTGLHVAFGKAMDYSDGEYGEAILSRFPLLNTRNHALEASGDDEPRAMLAATVDPGGGTPLKFFATHLDHQSSTVRMKQAMTIMSIVHADNNPMILAGDFNAEPKSESIALLGTSWTEATNKSGTLTFPSKDPKVKIDYVFYRPAKSFRIIEVRTLDEPVASDHCPVLVVMEFLPTAE